MLEDAIFELVSSAAGVGARVYPRKLPQTDQGDLTTGMPAVTYHRISTPNIAMAHDDAPGADQLLRPRIQLDCWGSSADEAAEVAQRIRHALHGFRGVVAGVEIQHITVEDEPDNTGPFETVADDARFRRVIDTRWTYQEKAPVEVSS